MRVFHQMGKYLYLEVMSADPVTVLSKLIENRIVLWDIQYEDALTVRIKIRQKQFSYVRDTVEKQGGKCRILKKDGYLWTLLHAVKRPVLVFGVLVLLTALFFIQGRILFVQVSGNDQIPDKLILSCAEECGIGFGTIARNIRSETVKNQLLSKLSSLQWVGVNTRGCVATIHVKERSVSPHMAKIVGRVSSIVAARDGLICEMTVLKGNPLCAVGSTVKKGDVLVSGYTDCGIKVLAENAEAEVRAYTFHKETFCAIPPSMTREKITPVHTCYSLKLGKKVINLCNHSGILDATCVKMYLEKFWSLPGAFRLPVSIISEVYLLADTVETTFDAEQTFQWLERYSQDYLRTTMTAGELISSAYQKQKTESLCILHGAYVCQEMIGQVKYEENLD